jgi:hypothetical protein
VKIAFKDMFSKMATFIKKWNSLKLIINIRNV